MNNVANCYIWNLEIQDTKSKCKTVWQIATFILSKTGSKCNFLPNTAVFEIQQSIVKKVTFILV